jgi:predicted enzyme related to lactoylglutathione lyase
MVVWDTHVWVDDADEAAVKIKEAGGTALTEPFDVGDSGRMGFFADPYGAVFRIWQANNHRGAQIVNAPGSWNWSNLETSDLEGSSSFYGAVFGWESDIVDFGQGSFAMCRLPGYGDFLEQFDPELRTRQGDAGAPSGFEDAVAWMVPLSNDGSAGKASPHWSVTFSVDDTDAVAERAGELGGRIVVPPVDTPPARVAILSDPQGAVFSVSKYDPEMEPARTVPIEARDR